MAKRKSSLPDFFKGIALFTPGGDLIYGIDPNKQVRWHLHLCLALQEVLGLSEPPYFLVPGYTATIDRWENPQTGQIEIFTEVYPAVTPYIPLLQILFETEDPWQIVPWREEHCNPGVLESYRQEFPQLWEEQDLIIRLDPDDPYRYTENPSENLTDISASENNFLSENPHQNNKGYVLRLFIASNNLTTDQTLDKIHQILERGLTRPYTLKIIDITKHPEQAEINQISATPTLVRVWPQPVKKIVGELNDLDRIIKIISS